MKKRSVIFVALLCVTALLMQGCAILGLGSLFGLELSATEIYYTYATSVVEIRTEGEGSRAVGSGFFYDENGTVITNYHVIENFASAKVYSLTGEEYEVKGVKGYDIKRDIAILETDCKDSVPLQLNTNSMLNGAKVYTIGSSLGMTGTLSEGIVSCALRQLYNYSYIQITAPISPGNSGGPLFDAYGNVVGINTLTFLGGQNVNLAIPAEEILEVDTEKPTTLEKLFTRTSTGLGRVNKLENWSVGYVPEEDSTTEKDVYTILFQLRDKENNLVKTGGDVAVKIVNDDDVTVYENTLTYSQSDILTVKTREGEFEFMAVNVPVEDVRTGDTCFGVFSFTVSSWDYAFDPVPVRLLDLPVL